MSNEIKEMPHSIESEQSVIGALLIDNDAIDRIADLREEHFYLSDHAAIFGEIMRQLSAGKSCDLISVSVVLGEKIKDCLQYINSIILNTPSSASIGRYSAIVRDKATKRALVLLGKNMSEEAFSLSQDSSALIDDASSKLEKLAEQRIRNDPVRASDDLVEHIDQIEKRMDGIVKSIPTGFDAIDKKMNGGFRRGELIVVAARPKIGKTSFSLNVACNMANDYSVLFLSMEMPKSQLHDRNIAALGGIPLPNLLQPHGMRDQDWNGLTAAIQKIQKMNLYIDDQGGMRLFDVRMKAKFVKRRHGLDVLVIDYLQLMDGPGDNRNSQIETITRGLKALAKELDVVIILLSQLNRELEKRPNKRPMPSDLRDSGAIEQDADAVIFLYRDEVYNKDSRDIGIAEIDIALCRQGQPGVVALQYEGIYTRFSNMNREWSQQSDGEKEKDERSRRRSML
jgi:replicative DNA helicase